MDVARRRGDGRRGGCSWLAVVLSGCSRSFGFTFQSRAESGCVSGPRMQHILESELEDLKKSRFQGPGMSWVAPFLVSLRVLEVQRAAVCGLLPAGQGTRPVGVLTPRGASLERSGRPAASIRPRRRTGPCHVPLSAASHPAFRGWPHVPRLGTWPGLQAEPGGTDPCSVLAQRPALASGSGGQRLLRLPPGSRFSPLPAPRPPTGAHTHSAPTFSPSPASPVPLTPLDAVCLSGQTRGPSRRAHCGPCPLSAWVAVPRRAVVCRPGPRQPPCCGNLSGARTCNPAPR